MLFVSGVPSPAQLCDRITLPHLIFHLETLRQKYIKKRYNTQHPILTETINTQHTYNNTNNNNNTPLSTLLAIFHYTLHPDRSEEAQIEQPCRPHLPLTYICWTVIILNARDHQLSSSRPREAPRPEELQSFVYKCVNLLWRLIHLMFIPHHKIKIN